MDGINFNAIKLRHLEPQKPLTVTQLIQERKEPYRRYEDLGFSMRLASENEKKSQKERNKKEDGSEIFNQPVFRKQLISLMRHPQEHARSGQCTYSDNCQINLYVFHKRFCARIKGYMKSHRRRILPGDHFGRLSGQTPKEIRQE
jgi:hypothetical protein